MFLFSCFLVQYFHREWHYNVFMHVRPCTNMKKYQFPYHFSSGFNFSLKKSKKNPFNVYWIWKKKKNKEATDLRVLKSDIKSWENFKYIPHLNIYKKKKKHKNHGKKHKIYSLIFPIFKIKNQIWIKSSLKSLTNTYWH